MLFSYFSVLMCFKRFFNTLNPKNHKNLAKISFLVKNPSFSYFHSKKRRAQPPGNQRDAQNLLGLSDVRVAPNAPGSRFFRRSGPGHVDPARSGVESHERVGQVQKDDPRFGGAAAALQGAVCD